ncbi:hypothetical protein F4775DRAFT_290698 [Biscogniauxia sp. FL1348]|nr:hypothetical protein F4775DRAFT_290698 [Biscogniauxia sp. FL1348]
MPAPTALLKPQQQVEDTPLTNTMVPEPNHDDEFALEGMNELPEEAGAFQPPRVGGEEDMAIDEENKPRFAPIQNTDLAVHIQTRKCPIPPHRFTPLKNNWIKIYTPLVEHLKLQVRMNVKNKRVELRTSKHTTDTSALQKGADFITAFSYGFDIDDAIALLRMDELFIETFEVKDVKTLTGDHLARAIGRICGNQGKVGFAAGTAPGKRGDWLEARMLTSLSLKKQTKFAIENTSKTRIVVADSKIHILGAYKNIKIARESVVSLILGKPPGKVYNNLRTVSSRMKERF